MIWSRLGRRSGREIKMDSKEPACGAAGRPVDRAPVSHCSCHCGEPVGHFLPDLRFGGLSAGRSPVEDAQLFGVDALTACSDAFRVSADLGGEVLFPKYAPVSGQTLVSSEAM